MFNSTSILMGHTAFVNTKYGAFRGTSAFFVTSAESGPSRRRLRHLSAHNPAKKCAAHSGGAFICMPFGAADQPASVKRMRTGLWSDQAKPVSSTSAAVTVTLSETRKPSTVRTSCPS